MACLDSFGEEISSLGDVVGVDKGGGELVHHGDTRGVGLEDKAKETNHGQTAVLDFLKLLLSVLLRGVVEAERVEAALSPALSVTGLVVGSIFQDDAHATKFHDGHEGEDLEKRRAGGTADGLQGVGVSEGVRPFVTADGSETWGDETKNGNHADTSVHQLSLAVPGQTIGGGISSEKAVEVRTSAGGLGGKVARVETDITNEGSVQKSRCSLVRDGLRCDGCDLIILVEKQI